MNRPTTEKLSFLHLLYSGQYPPIVNAMNFVYLFSIIAVVWFLG